MGLCGKNEKWNFVIFSGVNLFPRGTWHIYKISYSVLLAICHAHHAYFCAGWKSAHCLMLFIWLLSFSPVRLDMLLLLLNGVSTYLCPFSCPVRRSLLDIFRPQWIWPTLTVALAATESNARCMQCQMCRTRFHFVWWEHLLKGLDPPPTPVLLTLANSHPTKPKLILHRSTCRPTSLLAALTSLQNIGPLVSCSGSILFQSLLKIAWPTEFRGAQNKLKIWWFHVSSQLALIFFLVSPHFTSKKPSLDDTMSSWKMDLVAWSDTAALLQAFTSVSAPSPQRASYQTGDCTPGLDCSIAGSI